MKHLIIIIVCLGILFPLKSYSQDFSTYKSRKQWILQTQKDAPLVGWGKHGIPRALARLTLNPHDQGAIVYLANILDNRGQTMFDFPGVALALCRYWDSFTPEQREKMKASVQGLAKEDKIDGEGFMGHGTENHALMMWAGAYLFAQQFPDAQWRNGMTSEQLKAEMKERLRKTLRNYYDHGNTEYLSTTYEMALIFPIEILLECAKDPEVKAIAEAFMLFQWSLVSLNNFDGINLAPYGRMNTQQDHLLEDCKSVTNIAFYNWLLWGWGEATNNVRLDNYKMNPYFSETSYSIYTAVSNMVPDDIFFRLANLKTPFLYKSSASSFGHYGTGVPHLMMRKVYRDKTYAIGTGNYRWVPGGDYADHDADGFMIAWSSPKRFNYIGCYHPFWYSDGDEAGRTPDTWNHGNISPFQQTAHHKSSVVTLFDIPDKDPWPDKPSEQKWAWRDGHAGNLLKRGMIRYPKAMDEEKEENGWLFMREGKTYIGIKPLKSYIIQRDLTGDGTDGFNIIKSDHAKTGFIFELGSEETFGSFDKFRSQLQKNRISIDWDKMIVSYTDSNKDKIQIQYIPGLPVEEIPVEKRPDHWPNMGVTGMAESVPVVTINGKRDTPYRQWPMIESPYINMDNNMLRIDDGQTKITVDWQKELPVISRSK